jgi:hypothetical protein
MKGFALGSLFFALLFSGCGGGQRNDYDEKLKKAEKDMGIHDPMWDRPIGELAEEFREEYSATDVRLGNRFYYRSKEDYSYWLSVSCLNPELKGKDFKKFSREVALKVVSHLKNRTDFEKIEVSVVEKKGFIISFTSNQNMFFHLDSLGGQ